jgi:hypothetical protein
MAPTGKQVTVSVLDVCGNDNVDVVHRRIDEGLGRDDTRPRNVGKYIYLVCDQYRVRIWAEVATNRFVGPPGFGRAELPTSLKASSDKSSGKKATEGKPSLRGGEVLCHTKPSFVRLRELRRAYFAFFLRRVALPGEVWACPTKPPSLRGGEVWAGVDSNH